MFKVLDAIAVLDSLREVAVEMQISVAGLRETVLTLGHGSLDEEVVKALRSFGERGATSREVRDKIEDSTGTSLHVREIRQAVTRLHRDDRLDRVVRGHYVVRSKARQKTMRARRGRNRR